MEGMETIPELRPFVKQYAVLLSTRRQDGTHADTPVNIAVEGDHAYIRTFSSAWKVERMRNHPVVMVGPCTLRGLADGAADHGARPPPPGRVEGEHARRPDDVAQAPDRAGRPRPGRTQDQARPDSALRDPATRRLTTGPADLLKSPQQ